MKRFAALMALVIGFLSSHGLSTAQTAPFQRSPGSPSLGGPMDLDEPAPQTPPARGFEPAQPRRFEPTQSKGVEPMQPKGVELLQPPGKTIMHPPNYDKTVAAPKLASAQLEKDDLPLPINLAAALQLADARPLVVQAAQASAWAAQAQLDRARVLWIPTLNFGFDYWRHDGYGPYPNRGENTAASPLNSNINQLYAGAGMMQMNKTTDMIFAPLAARQTLRSAQFDIQAAKNDVLLTTAAAYFEVHRYRGMYAGTIDVVIRGKDLVKRLNEMKKDLVPRIEVDRAIQTLADFEQQAVTAREFWRVHSAYFTQALRLDPRTVVVPLEPDHMQITLIDPGRPLDELMPVGLINRPELASQQALVQAVIEKIRQEKFRPLLPSLMISGFQTPNDYFQGGAVGIGSGSNMNLWSGRDDFSVQPYWQLENAGFGNLARIKEQRANQSLQLVRLLNVQDTVAAEITRAQARMQSAAVRVLQADRSLREAIITYDGNLKGLGSTKELGAGMYIQLYRPQEVVVALEHLKSAYDQYFTTVADYNRSQFEMFRALGYPARELSQLRTPGDPSAVDLDRRVRELPPVNDHGPPPATR